MFSLLSGNKFNDNDAHILSKPIEEHPGLKYVNLSNNNFGDGAGTAFSKTISMYYNQTLVTWVKLLSN